MLESLVILTSLSFPIRDESSLGLHLSAETDQLPESVHHVDPHHGRNEEERDYQLRNVTPSEVGEGVVLRYGVEVGSRGGGEGICIVGDGYRCHQCTGGVCKEERIDRWRVCGHGVRAGKKVGLLQERVDILFTRPRMPMINVGTRKSLLYVLDISHSSLSVVIRQLTTLST